MNKPLLSVKIKTVKKYIFLQFEAGFILETAIHDTQIVFYAVTVEQNILNGIKARVIITEVKVIPTQVECTSAKGIASDIMPGALVYTLN
jgi:hypothetical protein